MLEVAALTAGRDVPSSRFRICQHVPRLAEEGVRVTDHCPAIGKYAEFPFLGNTVRFRYKFPVTTFLWAIKTAARLPGVVGSWRADVTWLSRDLIVGLPTLESMLGKPLVLDVDDAIWTAWPFGHMAAGRTARHSALVIAGNEAIASWFDTHAKRVEVVPTAVDTERFRPRSQASLASIHPLVLGWIGSASNLPYLQLIVPALREVMRRHPESRLRVVSDVEPKLGGLDPNRVDFIRWSAETEAADVGAMDIGLMPLPDNEWTRCKCSLKMLQYLACGIPAVVSPVGMNAEVLMQGEVGLGPRNHDEWIDALTALLDNADLRARLGIQGRSLVESRYAASIVAARLALLLKSVS